MPSISSIESNRFILHYMPDNTVIDPKFQTTSLSLWDFSDVKNHKYNAVVYDELIIMLNR